MALHHLVDGLAQLVNLCKPFAASASLIQRLNLRFCLRHTGAKSRLRRLGLALTITHIDFLSVWPRASPRPTTSSHAGHAIRSARPAYRPSSDSGDHRDGRSTTLLARASAAPPLAR